MNKLEKNNFEENSFEKKPVEVSDIKSEKIPDKKKNYLLKSLSEFKGMIDDKKLNQLLTYYYLLAEWNQFMNLTSITEFSDVVIKHFLDSIKILQYADIKENARVLDFGTGAGFPGIPLKILRPDLRITLMDSLNKRIKFLDEVINKTGLKGITAIHGRGEELGRKEEYREQYDFVLSRAVANLNTLSEYCIPFVKNGGWFISYKSGEIKEELSNAGEAVKLLGGGEPEVLYFDLINDGNVNDSNDNDNDGNDDNGYNNDGKNNDDNYNNGNCIKRSFIKIQKVKSTPNKYPRGGGKPLNEPLKIL